MTVTALDTLILEELDFDEQCQWTPHGVACPNAADYYAKPSCGDLWATCASCRAAWHSYLSRNPEFRRARCLRCGRYVQLRVIWIPAR